MFPREPFPDFQEAVPRPDFQEAALHLQSPSSRIFFKLVGQGMRCAASYAAAVTKNVLLAAFAQLTVGRPL